MLLTVPARITTESLPKPCNTAPLMLPASISNWSAPAPVTMAPVVPLMVPRLTTRVAWLDTMAMPAAVLMLPSLVIT